MPRAAHRNGQDGRRGQRGCSKRSFCIVCGVNELGDCFCDMGGRGAEGSESLGRKLLGRVPRGSLVVTDDNLAYDRALAGWARHEAVRAGGPVGAGGINMVNSLHSRLRAFLAPMRGVSSRRLQRYLDWFCYREQFKRAEGDRRELLYRHEAEGRYVMTRGLTHLEGYPEYWWWARQMPMVV